MNPSLEIRQKLPYLVIMPYDNQSNDNNKDQRFVLTSSEIFIGSGDCTIKLAGLELKHARVYFSHGKWYFYDLTDTLKVSQQGLLVRWFPLEFDSQTFIMGPWLCCFFTGADSEASSYDKNLKNSGETDDLTGLPLRAPLNRRLQYEIDHIQKNHQPVSVIHLDLDHFHHLNEQYGHPGGDAVLISLSKRMRAQTRGREMVSRYGGEEFVILLPFTSEKQVLEVAERLRRVIADVPIEHGNTFIPVTASLGCATTHQSISPFLLIAQADRAMYRAKQMGRNCVCLFDSSVDHVSAEDLKRHLPNISAPSALKESEEREILE